ncbi:hypothetical protein [Martelella alba]|uniref:hypothetical protein n=1 Tax=Martelella alba TaxID=2590451 RepID=UPI0015E86263|nr:hypothetical protein [Martelella alba]
MTIPVKDKTSAIDPLLNPAVLARVTGVKQPEILSALAASRFLKDALTDRINSQLPPLPDNIPDAQERNYILLSSLSAEQFHCAARRITLLICRQAVLKTTAGQQLKMLSEWVGDAGFLRQVVRSHSAAPQAISPLSDLDSDLLDSFDQLVLSYLLGLLHPAHRARFIMQLDEDDLPDAEMLGDADRKRLLELLHEAWPVPEPNAEPEADHGTSQN